MTPWCFPKPVLLPDAPVIENLRLSIALGKPSRQLVHSWKKRRAFPASYRSGSTVFYMTDHVENWLKNQNIMVKRV
tara:strand:- start:2400 stop:2627 length:228 start_codon:yes stop_codon:yes gene_type:complete